MVFSEVTVMTTEEAHFFRERLLAWHSGHQRPLPWKGERDPYKVWLSEIILQQTRVEQGLPYYERFVAAYPTVEHLARAPLDDVLKRWQGLGYYSRARNLHAAARYIAFERGGAFPSTYEEIRALKGVGDYTAAAIASFAFDLPHAVLDGNVYRVLARFFGIETPVNTPEAQKRFSTLAQQLLDPSRPGAYNQAIMDFGARHCRPRQPLCEQCPLAERCVASRQGHAEAFPRKNPPTPRQHRFFLYAVFRKGDMVWVQQRPAGDIWAHLYEFALWETDALPAEPAQITPQLVERFLPEASSSVALKGIFGPYRQTLSHRVVHALFFVFEAPADATALTPNPKLDTPLTATWMPVED
ncbi:MAG: A/G-specific adenine glycosylase, partial [Saprospiraceae bacterium]|nr:A/G-specific adenine glycosylase [Saprospiraceae bacterium]